MPQAPPPPTPAQCRTRGWRLLGIQFGALAALSILAAWLDLDRRIAGLFYSPEAGWRWADAPLWTGIYKYGTIPGLILTLGALVAWLAGFSVPRLRPWRPYCLVVVLTTALAAGFLVNAVLKQYWGRPRPDQTVAFGGQWEYRNIFPPGRPGKGASFPCGHCTMGFVFLSLAFCRNRSRTLSAAGVGTALVLGGMLGAGRMVQGSHYATDVLWAGGLVSMTATALYYLVLAVPAGRPAQPPTALRPVRKWLLAFAGLVVAAAMTTAFMTRRPFFETHLVRARLPDTVSAVELAINADPERVDVKYAPGPFLTVRVHAHGFGWAYFDYHFRGAASADVDTARIRISVDARSYFAELDHALEIILPEWARDRVAVSVKPIHALPAPPPSEGTPSP